MKLIQIFAFAAALVASTMAQMGGQTTDSSAPPKAKPQQPASTDSKKKDSAKPNAATKKTSSGSTQGSGIQVIVPTTAGSQATSSSNKNAAKPATPANSKTSAGVKPTAQPALSGKSAGVAARGSSAAVKTTTGTTAGKGTQAKGAASSTGTAAGSKTAAPGNGGVRPVIVQSKQTAPATGASTSSKQTAGKQTGDKQTAGKQAASKNASASKGATKTAPVVKIAPPRIVPKKPSKAELVVAARASSKVSSGGRRDPFVSPIRTVTAPTGPIGPNCSTGKRCLAINELTVQGTAKDTDGKMMAIVASSSHRAYFLRENDQVFNGSVQRITSDSVIFRESITDSLGRQNTHEVVKKISPI